MAKDIRHRVPTDVGLLEHEGITGVVADQFDARYQAAVIHPRRAVLKLAHLLVNQSDQILEPIRHRRIDRKTRGLGICSPNRRPFCPLSIEPFGDRNEFSKNLDFFIMTRPTAEKDLDHLVKSEQPKRQPEIARTKHQCGIPKTAPVFVMAIQQEYSQVWLNR